MIIRQFPDILWHFEGFPPPSPPGRPIMGGDFTPWTEFCWGGLMGGTYARWGGGGFLAKALDPEGPPPAQKTLTWYVKLILAGKISLVSEYEVKQFWGCKSGTFK